MLANVFIMENLERYLDSIGEKSSIERLEMIASMNLGERSDAARRVCEKRYRRKELMDMGLSFEDAVLIVNRERICKIYGYGTEIKTRYN